MRKTTKLFVGLALLLSITSLSGVLIATAQNPAGASTQETDSSAASTATLQYAEGVIEIALGDTISVSGEGATVDGTTVHITAAGVYSVSGTLADGRIEVDAKGKVYLEFDGVDVTSSSGPALTITDAKKVTLTLVDGTTNYLTDAAADNEYDAALFTNDTLIINGAGTLIVTGNNNEGISSDDDIIVNAGTVEVTAVDDGLNAHDDITITGGHVYIHAGGDGLDSNGTINISGGTLISLGSTAGGDGGLDAGRRPAQAREDDRRGLVGRAVGVLDVDRVGGRRHAVDNGTHVVAQAQVLDRVLQVLARLRVVRHGHRRPDRESGLVRLGQEVGP